jgi:hypothetical protein
VIHRVPNTENLTSYWVTSNIYIIHHPFQIPVQFSNKQLDLKVTLKFLISFCKFSISDLHSDIQQIRTLRFSQLHTKYLHNMSVMQCMLLTHDNDLLCLQLNTVWSQFIVAFLRFSFDSSLYTQKCNISFVIDYRTHNLVSSHGPQSPKFTQTQSGNCDIFQNIRKTWFLYVP